MKTHIIIPIADIEENIKFTMLALKHAPENQTLNDGLNFWTGILTKYKQISLDEKDIEEKAKAAFDDSYALKETRVQAYKQALNELK